MGRRYSEQEQYAKGFRSRVTIVFVILLFAVLGERIFELQVIHGAKYKRMAEENQIRMRRDRAPRGLILDRNGFVLAGNRPSFALAVEYAETPSDDSFRQRLADLVDVPRDLLDEGFDKARLHPWEPVRICRDISFEAVARLEEQKIWLPGTGVEVDPIRSYPNGMMACHLLGYQGEISEAELKKLRSQGYRPGDYLGRTGVEEMWEMSLHGVDGARFVRVDARGREVGPVTEKSPVRPIPGHNLLLTIDVALQAAAERAMEKVERGAAVAVDPRNGEVLALVSRPAFDPNAFAGGIDPSLWRVLSEDPARPLLDRALSAAYPPGSTFKVITASCAVELGHLGEETRLRPCTGSYWFGDRSFGCWKKEGHGSLDLRSAIVQSCDVFFYQVGERLELDELSAFMMRFGFGARTGIDLPSEAYGHVPTTEGYNEKYGVRGWTRGLMLNLAIGQGEILATPVQMVQVAAAFGNGGRFWTPHLFLRLEEPGGRILREARVRSHRIDISEKTLAVLGDAMLGVVEDEKGTGRAARVPGVRVAGKTGTAQNPHGEDHAWFIALAPVDDPRVALAVVVENAGHGGSVAAPIAGEILRAFFAQERERPEPPIVAEGAKETGDETSGF
jgi:penicillin-binding protein 2